VIVKQTASRNRADASNFSTAAGLRWPLPSGTRSATERALASWARLWFDGLSCFASKTYFPLKAIATKWLRLVALAAKNSACILEK
jgi:hypothetical protein